MRRSSSSIDWSGRACAAISNMARSSGTAAPALCTSAANCSVGESPGTGQQGSDHVGSRLRQMYPGALAQETPDHPAVIMGGTGEVITYRQLDEQSNQLAHALRAAGLQPGDQVAFMMENHPRFFAIAWAARRAGLYFTAISSRLQREEVAYILKDCGAQAFIASKYVADVAAAVLPDAPNVRLALMLDGTVDGFDEYDAVVGAMPVTPIDDEVEGEDMLYSSGTTGRPKGVRFPLPLDPIGTPPALVRLCQLLFLMDEKSVYLSPAPLYHAAPLRFSMVAHRLGGTVVVMEHFDPADALRLIERHHVTHGQFVPTMFIRMLKLPDEERLAFDVSSLQVAIHAAAPCPVEVKQRMIEWWGPVLHEYYAGTEGNGFVYTGSEDWLAHPGTVGRALAGTVHIVDEDGNDTPTGEAGTVYFEGGSTFEYHNDTEKTAASRDPKGRGWSTLGDVGYLDSDGFLYLT